MTLNSFLVAVAFVYTVPYFAIVNWFLNLPGYIRSLTNRLMPYQLTSLMLIIAIRFKSTKNALTQYSFQPVSGLLHHPRLARY